MKAALLLSLALAYVNSAQGFTECLKVPPVASLDEEIVRITIYIIYLLLFIKNWSLIHVIGLSGFNIIIIYISK